jgi:hypothetical protein
VDILTLGGADHDEAPLWRTARRQRQKRRRSAVSELCEHGNGAAESNGSERFVYGRAPATNRMTNVLDNEGISPVNTGEVRERGESNSQTEALCHDATGLLLIIVDRVFGGVSQPGPRNGIARVIVRIRTDLFSGEADRIDGDRRQRQNMQSETMADDQPLARHTRTE